MAKTRMQCRQEATEEGLDPRSPEFARYVLNCMREREPGRGGGEDGGGGDLAVGPCKHGGHLGHQVKKKGGGYALLTPCEKGFKAETASDGRIWCCKKAPQEEEEETGGEPCAGGYKLSDNPIMPGKGDVWIEAPYFTAEAGWRRDPSAAGHWVWHPDWGYQHRNDVIKYLQGQGTLTKNEGGACRKNYQPETINGEVWCCPEAETATTEAAAGAGGEFQWSPELRESIRSLLARFEQLLDRPMGLKPEERQAIVNYALRGLRAGERGQIQSERDWLSRMGLGGQPFEAEQIAEIKRGTRRGEADIRSTLAIDEIDKALQTLLGTTSTASNLLSTLMTTEQIPEMLSAGRRGESMDYQRMLLDYLVMLMGGEANSPYWDIILKRALEEEPDIWDYLPWLSRMF
jgi:hypothetical protein